MNRKLTSLSHLRMASSASRALSAQVASAAAEAIEELEARAVTMEDVNGAIDAALGVIETELAGI